MKKFLLIIILFLIIMMAMITLRFGNALFQEGNPIPILAAIVKLETLSNEYEQFSETDVHTRYVSANTRDNRFDVIYEYMKETSWEFKEQMGSGLVFENDQEILVVGTRQFSKHYILWDIPSEVVNNEN